MVATGGATPQALKHSARQISALTWFAFLQPHGSQIDYMAATGGATPQTPKHSFRSRSMYVFSHPTASVARHYALAILPDLSTDYSLVLPEDRGFDDHQWCSTASVTMHHASTVLCWGRALPARASMGSFEHASNAHVADTVSEPALAYGMLLDYVERWGILLGVMTDHAVRHWSAPHYPIRDAYVTT